MHQLDTELVSLGKGNIQSSTAPYTLFNDDDNSTTITDVEKLFKHTIGEENGNPRLTTRQTRILATLQSLGGSAAIYSIPISYEYAKDKVIPYQICLMAGGVITSTLFLTHLTGFFFKGLFLKAYAPSAIRHLLKLPSKTQLVIEIISVSALSLICAIAFAVPTFLYPAFSDEKGWVALEVIHSEIAQAIIHATAWSAIWNGAFPLFNTLITPVKWAIQNIYNHCWLTPAERKILQHKQQQEAIYQKYREHLSIVFGQMAETLVAEEINSRRLPENQRKKYASNSQVYTLKEFTRIAYSSNPPKTFEMDDKSTSSKKWFCCTALHQVMKSGGATAIGAGLFTLATLSTTINPFYIAHNMMELDFLSAVFATALPIFSAGALAALYGGIFGNRLYNFMTSLHLPNSKVPIEALQYPKIFKTLFLINLYLSIFSFGPTQQLITIIFGDPMWDLYRPTLRSLAYSALPTVSCMSILDLTVDIMRELTVKHGNYEDKMISSLLLNADILNKRLLQMLGKNLMKSLTNFSSDLKLFLGIDSSSLEQDLKTLKKLQLEIKNLTSLDPQQKINANEQRFLNKKLTPHSSLNSSHRHENSVLAI